MSPVVVSGLVQVGLVCAVCAVVAVGWRRGWRGLVQLFDHREPGTALAMVRMGLGASLWFTFYGVWRAGVAHALWVDRAHGGYKALKSGSWLMELLGGPTVPVVDGLFAAGIVFSLLLVLGLGGRFTAFAGLQILMALERTNGDAGGSYDLLLANGLWLLVLAPSTATLSLDCRLRTGRWVDHRPVVAWPRYLLVLQLVLTYWATGVQKLSTYWTPGGDFSALYYIFQQPTWHRFDLSFMAWVFPLTQIGTAVTWFWEVLYPLILVVLWWRYTAPRGGWLRTWSNRLDLRSWFVLVGVIMHVGLLLLMDVGPFTPITLSFYLALYHPDEYAQAWQRLRRLTARAGSPPGSPGRTAPAP